MFLKISKILQENICARAQTCNFIKKEALAHVFFCEICNIFKNTFFIKHLRTTASDTKQTSPVATTDFFSTVPTRKKIFNEHFNLCEAEISLNEIVKSINSETNNKSSCNDALKTEFY